MSRTIFGMLLASHAALLPAPAHATAQDTEELLRAPKADKYIYVRLQKDESPAFRYSLDSHGGQDASAPMVDSLTIAGGSNVTLVLEYLNPIRYSWSTAEQVADEPTYLAAQKFFDSMKTLLTMVGVPSGAGTLGASTGGNAKVALRAMTGGRTTTRKLEVDETYNIYAPDLVEWALWANQGSFKQCLPSASDDFPKILAKADNALYSENDKPPADFQLTARKFREGATSLLTSLRDPETLDALRTAMVAVQKDLKTLHTDADHAATALDAARNAKIEWDKNKPDCDNYGRYTEGTIARFAASGDKIMAARRQLLSDLDDVIAKLNALMAKAGTQPGDNYFRVADIAIPPGKMKTVTVSVKRRDVGLEKSAGIDKIKIEDKQEIKTTIRLREAQSFVLEFAPGVIYTSIDYPKFGTSTGADGKITVASAGKDTQNVSAVAMLNLIPRLWTGPVHLTGQIGVGLGKPYPLLLAGAGVRILPINVALTGGVVWTWTRQLDKLKIDDTVKGTADVEGDLTYKFRSAPAPYVGVQYSF